MDLNKYYKKTIESFDLQYNGIQYGISFNLVIFTLKTTGHTLAIKENEFNKNSLEKKLSDFNKKYRLMNCEKI